MEKEQAACCSLEEQGSYYQQRLLQTRNDKGHNEEKKHQTQTFDLWVVDEVFLYSWLCQLLWAPLDSRQVFPTSVIQAGTRGRADKTYSKWTLGGGLATVPPGHRSLADTRAAALHPNEGGQSALMSQEASFTWSPRSAVLTVAHKREKATGFYYCWYIRVTLSDCRCRHRDHSERYGHQHGVLAWLARARIWLACWWTATWLEGLGGPQVTGLGTRTTKWNLWQMFLPTALTSFSDAYNHFWEFLQPFSQHIFFSYFLFALTFMCDLLSG